MSDDCLFCKITAGEIDANWVRQEATWGAFRDINPQAPTHVLVIPRKHIATLDDLTAEDAELVGQMFLGAKEIAAAEGLSGYRAVFNCGREAGQSVFHIHLHILGGRALSWPPG